MPNFNTQAEHVRSNTRIDLVRLNNNKMLLFPGRLNSSLQLERQAALRLPHGRVHHSSEPGI
jgi:hypothetical protein